MSGYVGSKEITEVYVGNKEVTEIYKGSDLIYSSYQPVSNFLFRDIDANGILSAATGVPDSGVGLNKLKPRILQAAFYNYTSPPKAQLTGEVNLSDLRSISEGSLSMAFFRQIGVTGVDLSKLTIINGQSALSNAFYSTRLVNVNFPELTTIKGQYALNQAFYGCVSLRTISFPKLTTIENAYRCFFQTFDGCSNLESVSFPLLSNIIGTTDFVNAFSRCTGLTQVSFPSLISNNFTSGNNIDFTNMLIGVTGCTVHFPSNLQAVIGNRSDVTSGFNGTNTVILFDLANTE